LSCAARRIWCLISLHDPRTSIARSWRSLRSRQDKVMRVLTIYFAGAISGGRADVAHYRRVVAALENDGHRVLAGAVASEDVGARLARATVRMRVCPRRVRVRHGRAFALRLVPAVDGEPVLRHGGAPFGGVRRALPQQARAAQLTD